MAKPRLGKAERAIVREWHHQRHQKTKAIVQSNLDAPKPKPDTSALFRANQGKKQKPGMGLGLMTVGLYRGLYDPLYSTDKDTGRGLKPRKATVKKPWYVSKDKGRTI